MIIHFLEFQKINKYFIFSLFLFSTIALSLFQKETAEALCVKDKKANLRSGPGKQKEKLWTVLKYMPFKQVGRKGSWLRVQDLDGDIYWIYRTITTKSYMCAVIKNNKTVSTFFFLALLLTDDNSFDFKNSVCCLSLKNLPSTNWNLLLITKIKSSLNSSLFIFL